MDNPSTSSMIVSVESLNLSGTSTISSNMGPSSASMGQQNRTSSHGPVAILWDIENCPIPSDVRPEDVAGNIRMALRVHPIIKGAVTLFSAYGDFNAFPRRLREGCQRTGVKLVDVPNGRKDAADKAILVDMFLFALDNRPPSSILLISGDVDFSPALHILGQRGYTVILVIPSGVGVSSALSNAGRFVWDWPSVARGEGFVPPKSLISRGSTELAGYLLGSQYHDGADGQNEEEAIVYRGVSQSEYTARANMNQIYYTRMSQSVNECTNNLLVPCFPSSRSHSLPSGLSEVSTGPANEVQDQLFVLPGDINGLKAQFVKLLELSGGSLPLVRLPAEYHKLFGRPLYMAEYGVLKLVNLLKKMVDVMSVEGKSNKKFVYLRNSNSDRHNKTCITSPSSIKKDKKRKGGQEENNEISMCNIPGCSSDEYSDDERGAEVASDPSDEFEERLEQLKNEVQDLVVSCSCKVLLTSFKDMYEQRYKRSLDHRSFGVDELEDLIKKVGFTVLYEEDGSKRKFIIPNLPGC